MNIAFVHKWFDNIGGAEKNLCEMTQWFVRFGHEVHLYCAQFRIPPGEKMIPHRVPYLPLGKTAKTLSIAFLASRAALAGKHDVIISYNRVFKQDIVRCGGGTHRGFLNAVAPVRGSARNVLRWLGDQAVLYVERRQFNDPQCRRFIAMSHVVKKELMDFYHVPGDKIEVIYNGVDTSTHHPRNRELYGATIRKEHGISPDHALILFLGTGFLRKGLEFVLQAMSLLRDDRLRLLVVGYDANQSHYIELTRRLGLAGAVIFAGPQKQSYRFYGAADLLVLPSRYDPFGNVVLEGLANGLPVITTKNVGSSEMMEGRLRRFILNQADDVQAIAAGIRELMEPGLRSELSLLARKIAEKFTREANARAMEKLCLQVAEEKHGGR